MKVCHNPSMERGYITPKLQDAEALTAVIGQSGEYDACSQDVLSSYFWKLNTLSYIQEYERVFYYNSSSLINDHRFKDYKDVKCDVKSK